MAESGIVPPREGGCSISICESKVDSIRVRVLFSGINKEEADVSGKILNIHGMTVPMSRFGSWVFKNFDATSEIVRIGGPPAAFVWALAKCYPKVSAWMSDSSNCSFTLEFEEGQKKEILHKIASGNMQEKLKKALSEIHDVKFVVKFIKIENGSDSAKGQEQPSPSASEILSPAVKRKKKSSKATDLSEAVETTIGERLTYRKLKGELGKTQDRKEKLKKLIKFGICSFELGKLNEDWPIVSEVKTLMPNVQASQDDTRLILDQARKLGQLLHSNGNIVESIAIVLSSSNLARNIKKQDDRIDVIASQLVQVSDWTTEIYKIKSHCMRASVEEDDELDATRTLRRSGTKFERADKARRRGRYALKHHNYNEALRHFDEAIESQPNEMVYHIDKAEVYLAQGHYEKCKTSCAEALRLGGSEMNQGRIYSVLAERELRLHHPLAAMKLFRKSKDIHSCRDVTTKLQSIQKDFDEDRKEQQFSFPFPDYDIHDYYDYDDYSDYDSDDY